MDYQHVRNIVNKAVDIMDDRLAKDVTGVKDCIGWCSLDSLSFDQSLCGEENDHDETIVTVSFRWGDPIQRNRSGEISLYEEDMISPYFIAGMMHAYILREENLLS